MQHHLLAARPRGIGGKSRQDEVAAEQLAHHFHHVVMLNDALEDLALVDEVEDALVGAFGFDKPDAALALRFIQAVDIVTNLF